MLERIGVGFITIVVMGLWFSLLSFIAYTAATLLKSYAAPIVAVTLLAFIVGSVVLND